jgi:hypothetical protein
LGKGHDYVVAFSCGIGELKGGRKQSPRIVS